jgi:transcriptional regulator with XRE-family HTH domain
MKSEINYAEIGNRIRIQRDNFGMSREKLSELLNLSPYFLGQIERGQRKMSINTLINISQCLHISIDYLIFEQTNNDSNSTVLHSLLNRCSAKEVSVIEDIIKVIFPYLAVSDKPKE